MTVTFCRHRTLEHPVQVKSWLREVVCDLIGQGANTFLLGGMERLTSWLPKLFMS